MMLAFGDACDFVADAVAFCHWILSTFELAFNTL